MLDLGQSINHVNLPPKLTIKIILIFTSPK